MNDTINQVGAGAPAAWTRTKPTAPGAYWIRGEGEGMLARNALVEVVDFEGELWCNLHMRNTDPEFGYGYTVAQLDEAFEWLGPLAPAAPVVQHSDDAAVDRFAAAMKEKLAAARAKGRAGWDDPNVCPVETLAKLLISHLRKGNAGTFEDVANFAMMLHQRGADPRVLAEAAPVVQAEPVAWQLRLPDGRVMLEVEFPSWAEGDDGYEIRPLYAAQPAQPDVPRCQCCGYLVTESEHRGCLRSASPHPDAALVEALKDLLPNLDEALEDLELFGLHRDQGYRKLKDWYRKMMAAMKAIDAALTGKGGE